MQLAKGVRIGPYEVVDSVGAGGMGEVYRATDTRLDRTVAIKLLPAALSANPQLKLRFEREAKAISALNHPNICTLHDIGEIDGSGYLVMEFCEGETLADRVRKGPLPIEQVIRYGSQIADALHRAHQQGIVHRDLKPGNVMLTKTGAKLLDFGLARTAMDAIDPLHDATAHMPLTEEGTILGTFQYMAPEQVEGKPADARTDIFALGAVLYEMATGARAFEGSSRASLIASIMDRQPPPISAVQPLTPPALEHVIRRCLEKDPEDRWQSARDIASELRWISEAGSQAGVAAPLLHRRKSRERALWTAALLAVAALAGVAGWLMRRTGSEEPFSFEIPGKTDRYDAMTRPQISPDGSKVAFSALDEKGTRSLWVRPLDSLDATKLADAGGSIGYFWSADGNFLAFQQEGKLMKVPVTGGPAQLIVELEQLWSGAWNQDGVILVAEAETPLSRIDPGSTKREVITALDKGEFEFGHVHPEFLPDGKRFLFVANVRNPNRREHSQRLYAGRLDSKETTFIGEIPSRVSYVEPGILLAVRDGTLLAYPFDEKNLKITGDPKTVVDEVYFFKPTGNASFSVSRNGTLVVQSPRTRGHLQILDRSGLKRSGFQADGSIGSIRISPDGSQVAIAIEDPKLGTLDLWLYGLGRETRKRLTFDSGWENLPAWSPDGTRIFYGWDKKGWPDIYARVIDGSGEDEVVVAEPNVQHPRDVSPDGKWLLYQTFDDPLTRGDLYVMPIDRKGERQAFLKTPFAEGGAARFSPDGRFIAYTSNESGRAQVYVKPFPGPGPAKQISVEQASSPRWSEDGTEVLFVQGRKMMAAGISGATGAVIGEPRELFESPSEIDMWEPLPGDAGFIAALRNESATPPTRVYGNWKRLLGQ